MSTDGNTLMVHFRKSSYYLSRASLSGSRDENDDNPFSTGTVCSGEDAGRCRVRGSTQRFLSSLTLSNLGFEKAMVSGHGVCSRMEDGDWRAGGNDQDKHRSSSPSSPVRAVSSVLNFF